MRSVWLMYHDVYPERVATDLPRTAAMYHLSRAEFAAHLAVVRASRRRVITAAEPASGDTVSITFDDGWHGAFAVALPMLVDAGVRATFYVTRDFVGRPHMAQAGLIVEAARAGMEIGVHGTTHRMLAALTPAEIYEEFAACRAYLEDLIGKRVAHASLPGGDVNQVIVASAHRAGLESLCTSRPGVNRARTSRYSLKRIGIKGSTSPSEIGRYCGYNVLREEARWMGMQAPRTLLGMKNYSRLRRWILDREGKPEVFEP